jgi:hypothetical protein
VTSFTSRMTGDGPPSLFTPKMGAHVSASVSELRVNGLEYRPAGSGAPAAACTFHAAATLRACASPLSVRSGSGPLRTREPG